MEKQSWEDDFEMKAEYDFSNGVPNPYAALVGDIRIAVLEPDVWSAFPDSASVNEALRSLIKAANGAKELSKAG